MGAVTELSAKKNGAYTAPLIHTNLNINHDLKKRLVDVASLQTNYR
jgi:hypothetical protein